MKQQRPAAWGWPGVFFEEIELNRTDYTQLTQAELHEWLLYDPQTGLFTRKKRGRGIKLGASCERPHRDGYVRVQVRGGVYFAHRLAWLYVFGAWPASELDHINRIRNDNRIGNLREVTRSQNRQNSNGVRTSKSQLKGVHWENARKLWRSQIRVNGREVFLGRFKDPLAAHMAYVEAAKTLHTHNSVAA